jgi:ribosomal-protein-alanine N-acetyltransferase
VPEIINYFYQNREHLAPWQPLWHSNFLSQEFWQQQVEENLKEFQSDRSLKLFIFKSTHPTEIIGQVNFNSRQLTMDNCPADRV